MKNIAFFGLGNMGLPMAKNLLQADYTVKVSVFQGLREAPEELQKLGAILVDSQADMVRDADVIISIVPADAAVKEIYLNPEIRAAVPEHSVIIEMTSCAPETVIEIQKAYEDKHVKVIDAPVTGAKAGAINGTLTIMGAGDPKAFESVLPVLKAMGKEDYEPTFALKLLRKDMAIALDMAGNLPLPLSKRAYELYKNAAPYDEEDCAAIAKVEN